MNNAGTFSSGTILDTLSLRCVECSALYPSIEEGGKPRYRCDCGGVLDVEMQPLSAFPLADASQEISAVLSSIEAEGDLVPAAGSDLRQLFDGRATTPPIWSAGADNLLHDYSGVWRYRELILPVPEHYIISRPEGNTSLYPVGMENCGPGRIGHRQIGLYAGLERLYL